MCGISGFNWKDEGKISEMVGALSYRGPDAEGIYLDGKVSLGHNRLAIIDLDKRANQPMESDDGKLVIVFNGEIYNFKELKRELSGYSFRTSSDTEVILAGYKKWGRDVVEKLNGMFAFAIYDKASGEIFCARDHAGIKPFYYFWDGKKFIFSSDIKAILAHDIPRKLDQGAFSHYMRVLYAPEPMTMIEGIKKLPPGSRLTLEGSGLSVESYGETNKEKPLLSYGEAAGVLREKTIDAVGRQLVSDVPVGVYLSGGIDSSTVLFSMSRFHKDIKTFSVGFDLSDDEEKAKFNKDFELAARTSEFFGAEHYPLVVSAGDAASNFEEMISHASDPVSHPTSIAMMLLARHAKKEVAVTLTGNGGDELFGGYERYRMNCRADAVGKIPGAKFFLPGKIQRAIEMPVLDRFVQFEFEKDRRLEKVINQPYLSSSSEIKRHFEKYLAGADDGTEALMFADFRSWLPDYSFMLSDKMSMACALEERVPLVDKELVDFSRSIPRHYKVDMFRTKKILKDAFRRDLPDFLFREPKRGWVSPGAKWLRNPSFLAMAREILSEGYYAETAPLFDWAGLREMLERHVSKEEYNLTILWAVMTLQVWARSYRIRV